MKKSRLSYEEWKCIEKKQIHGKRVKINGFEGYIGLLNIEKVTVPQIWKFNGEDIVVCDEGLKWLSILPENDFYCITAMLDENSGILLWYIDMIASQGIDEDGVPYFDDLYLDLVVYPDGTVIEDDMDELEEALSANDISRGQYQLALDTAQRLKEGLLSDIKKFVSYTHICLNEIMEA